MSIKIAQLILPPLLNEQGLESINGEAESCSTSPL